MRTGDDRSRVASEQLDSLVRVLDLIRSDAARTRPQIGRVSGFGRTVVTERVRELLQSGLVVEGPGASTGGRAPRELSFNANAGHLLVAQLGATSIDVGIADLSGEIVKRHSEPADVASGPDVVLGRVEMLFDKLLAGRAPDDPPVWAVGIGVPGPVEFAVGKPIAPPIMPGWDGYPVRDRLAERYRVPAWVDNDVNLMALGELRRGLAQGQCDVVFVKIGYGIGAGLISQGSLHRGAQGVAGDIGHIAVTDDESVVCRCGNVGCLEALAGGEALGWRATAAATEGRSALLEQRLVGRKQLEASDVAAAAVHGDPLAVQLLTEAGRLVGDTLAKLVNFYNPSLVIIGGGVSNVGDLLLASIRQAIYRRSLPLATRDLRIEGSALGENGGLTGAAFMIIDAMFSRDRLGLWIGDRSPAVLATLPPTGNAA
jgi:glucokinase-like ROK family protein